MPNTTAVRTAQVGAAPFFAGKNAIINGDFAINQRQFTSNTTSGSFNFDRWAQFNGGTSGTLTVTPQTFTPGSAPVAGYEATNFLQGVTASGANADTFAFISQRIENVRTFAGQTATFSFWAKAASGTPKIALEIGQYFGSGGSPSTSVLTSVSAVTISTSWARYSITVNVPSISGKTIGTTPNTSYLYINIWLSAGTDFNSRASSIGLQNNTFQIWGVQIEAGSVATAFQTATGTLAGELAACQRYYYRLTALDNSVTIGTGAAASTTSIRGYVPLPVEMRVTPTSIDYSTLDAADNANPVIDVTTATLNTQSNTRMGVVTETVTGATQYRFYVLRLKTASTSYLGFSAEL